MYRFLQLLVFLALIVGGFFVYQHYIEPAVVSDTTAGNLPVVTFNGRTPLRVTVVDTEDEWVQGLSDTVSLPSTEGVLFIFDTDDYHPIWMKQMLYPIDIIWLDASRRVVDIRSNVTPDTYPKTFRPVTPARFVLEVNAHFAESFAIAVGDTLDVPKAILPESLRNQ